MPGSTTPGGWPYVLPSDLPVNYPELSLELATKLDDADEWLPWTPTLGGCVASSIDARYHRTRGGLVTINATITLTSVSGSVTLSAPVPPTKEAHGDVWFTNANGGNSAGVARVVAGGGIVIYAISTPSGGYATIANTSASVPFVFESGDKITATVQYQCGPAT